MLLHIILQPPTVYYNTPRGFTTTHIFLTTPGFVLQHLGQNRQHFWQETWAIVLQQWKLELHPHHKYISHEYHGDEYHILCNMR